LHIRFHEQRLEGKSQHISQEQANHDTEVNAADRFDSLPWPKDINAHDRNGTEQHAGKHPQGILELHRLE
jgi:hypothetical protein